MKKWKILVCLIGGIGIAAFLWYSHQDRGLDSVASKSNTEEIDSALHPSEISPERTIEKASNFRTEDGDLLPRFGQLVKSSNEPYKKPERTFKEFHGRTGTLGEIIKALNMKQDMTKFIDAMEIDLQQPVEVIVKNVGMVEHIELKIDFLDGLTFRGDVQKLVQYGKALWEEVPKSSTLDDAINVDVALAGANEMLSTLSIKEKFPKRRYQLSDNANDNRLSGAHWWFRSTQEYEGHGTNGTLSAIVSGYSGVISRFRYMPLLMPENMEVRLTEEEAIEAAIQFAESINISVENVGVESKWIAPADPGIWGEGRSEADYTNPRLYYRVFAQDAFEIGHGNRPLVHMFGVDCYTGEIVTGNRARH